MFNFLSEEVVFDRGEGKEESYKVRRVFLRKEREK